MQDIKTLEETIRLLPIVIDEYGKQANPRWREDRINEQLAVIARAQDKMAQIEQSYTEAPSKILDANRRFTAAKKDLLILQNQKAVDQIQKLYQELEKCGDTI